jgi:hypothetical protein
MKEEIGNGEGYDRLEDLIMKMPCHFEVKNLENTKYIDSTVELLDHYSTGTIITKFISFILVIAILYDNASMYSSMQY